MPYLVLFAGFALSLAAGVGFVETARRLALRVGWIDAPDGDRKAHARAVPSLGGVGILAAVIVGMLAMTLARDVLPSDWTAALTPPSLLVVLGAFVITLVGLADDVLDLDSEVKLIAQIAVTCLAYSGGTRVHVFDGLLGGGVLALSVSGALTGIWMVGLMNAVNLVDGLDGLAAGVVGIALLGLAGAHAVGGDTGSMMLVAATAGALLGFLHHNRPPARIFMGDSGSLLLGYLLATYALRGTAHPDTLLALVIPTVIVGLPVLEAGLSLLRRWRAGRPMLGADRDHLHHRLARRRGERVAVGVLYGVAAILAAAGVGMAAVPPRWAGAVLAVGVTAVGVVLWRTGALPPLGRPERAAPPSSPPRP